MSQPNTPYEGGVFAIAMNCPTDFPCYPLECRFLTPIYHPNIDSQGHICVDFLERNGRSPVWNFESSTLIVAMNPL